MNIARLHHLTQDHPTMGHETQARLSLVAGVRWIQFRSKTLGPLEKRKVARALQELTQSFGAILVINDDVALARDLGLGVHVGKSDMPPAEARALLGPGVAIGGTANTADDLLAIQKGGADYAGLGPWRPTLTKEKLSPVLGAEGARRVIAEARARGFRLPVVLIGGLTALDVPEVLACGAWGLAVSSAINLSPDPGARAAEILSGLEACCR